MERKKTGIIVSFVAIVLSSIDIASAQLPSPLPDIDVNAVQSDRYPNHDVTFPNDVRGIPSLVYHRPIDYRPLELDLYLPPSNINPPETGFPLVLFIHGGGWISGDTRHSAPFVDFPKVLASLSARGYTVASIEYCFSGEAKFPAQIQDVKAAIRWLRLKAEEYNVNPAQVMTWGVSAGGYLSGLAGVSCNAKVLEPVQNITPNAKPDSASLANVSDCVQGSVAWYGAFDIATITQQASQDNAMSRKVPKAFEWQLLGCFWRECKPEQIAVASPINYVGRDDPPMLLIVGTDDKTVPPRQTLEMSEKLDAVGVKQELIVLPDVGHSFIGKTPVQTRNANLKALANTFQFIDQTIGNSE